MLKKITKRLLIGLANASQFAAIFTALSLLLATVFYGTDFCKKLFTIHSTAEAWQQGIAYYLSALLNFFLLFTLFNSATAVKNKIFILVLSGLSGILTLPMNFLLNYLLSGALINFETIFLVVVLPFLLQIYLLIPLLLTFVAGTLTGLFVYAYKKLQYCANVRLTKYII